MHRHDLTPSALVVLSLFVTAACSGSSEEPNCSVASQDESRELTTTAALRMRDLSLCELVHGASRVGLFDVAAIRSEVEKGGQPHLFIELEAVDIWHGEPAEEVVVRTGGRYFESECGPVEIAPGPVELAVGERIVYFEATSSSSGDYPDIFEFTFFREVEADGYASADIFTQEPQSAEGFEELVRTISAAPEGECPVDVEPDWDEGRR